jgi:phosphoribosylformylglycinamidine cyclo-ligase
VNKISEQVENKLKRITYKDSGVDIDKSEQALQSIKSDIKTTFNSNVVTDIGLFGGMYELDKSAYDKPVLVSSTDGVGTKLKVAFLTNKHDTVGEDLVNHCLNDIAVGGAKPMFFLDYFSMGKLEPDVFTRVMSGFIRGCKNGKCALIGGETAEMPDLYQAGEYDLSGTIVGIVEKEKILDGRNIQKGNVLVGVNSSGLHTNGYSLARTVLFDQYSIDSKVDELDGTIGEELLKVHICYLNLIQDIISRMKVQGISHITGGGIEGNTKRLLQDDQKLDIDWQSWKRPAIFDLIQKTGNVPEEDMRRTFNLGIGLVFIVEESNVSELERMCYHRGYRSLVIGRVD